MVNVYIADGDDWRVKVHAGADFGYDDAGSQGSIDPKYGCGCLCLCVGLGICAILWKVSLKDWVSTDNSLQSLSTQILRAILV